MFPAIKPSMTNVFEATEVAAAVAKLSGSKVLYGTVEESVEEYLKKIKCF